MLRKLGVYFVILCLSLSGRILVGDDEKDPYDFQPTMPKGPYKGLVMDMSFRRPVFILPEEDAKKYNPQEGEMVVANFYHEGKFWIAKFPKDAVQDIYWQNEFFVPIVPHAQLRFKMKPGKEVELFPQVGNEPPKKAKIDDITVSSEASLVPNQERGILLLQGLKNYFAIALRVESTDEAYKQSVKAAKHLVTQMKLKMTDEQKAKALQIALQRSHDQQFNKMYNTINLTCTTEAMCILQEAVPKTAAHWWDFLGFRVGTFARHALWWRGMLDPNDYKAPTLNEEWAERRKAELDARRAKRLSSGKCDGPIAEIANR